MMSETNNANKNDNISIVIITAVGIITFVSAFSIYLL